MTRTLHNGQQTSAPKPEPEELDFTYLRTQPGLALYGTPEGIELVDPISNRQFGRYLLDDATLLEFLLACRNWLVRADAEKKLLEMAKVTPDEAAATVTHLIESGLLEPRSAEDHDYAVDRKPTWDRYGWGESFLLHWYTNSLPKLNYLEDGENIDREMMQQFLETETPPPNYKSVPVVQDARISLTKPAVDRRALLMSVFSSAPKGERFEGALSLADFTWLTYLAYGQTAMRNLHVTGKHVAKTSPSGGSRHPIEAYPIVVDVEGLAPGIYHYNVEHNRIDRIREGNYRGFISDHLIIHPDKPGFEPKVAYVYTCIFERSMYRYRDARSYRVMDLDLGHVMQTTAWLVEACGYRSYRGYSLDESVLEKALQIDGLMESVRAFCVVG